MKKNLVVISGAGISAESGLSTYRDIDGLWQQVNHEEVASPEAWKNNRRKVLEYWNNRRATLAKATPNEAHLSLVELEAYFHVHIITQNIDDLHEKAGSKNILHLHGEITKARSSVDRKLIYDLNGRNIKLGDRCEKNSQLRPHVIWFNEFVPNFQQALQLTKQANILVIVGCSLTVYPAAHLVEKRSAATTMFVVNPDLDHEDEFNIKEVATSGCKKLAKKLIDEYR